MNCVCLCILTISRERLHYAERVRHAGCCVSSQWISDFPQYITGHRPKSGSGTERVCRWSCVYVYTRNVLKCSSYMHGLSMCMRIGPSGRCWRRIACSWWRWRWFRTTESGIERVCRWSCGIPCAHGPSMPSPLPRGALVFVIRAIARRAFPPLRGNRCQNFAKNLRLALLYLMLR